uniref:Uncharacterized protein n=1 Tax=Panagrolaimus sp. JU765 TaxID=591449 RepID=A0AC34QQX0_9BILA
MAESTTEANVVKEMAVALVVDASTIASTTLEPEFLGVASSAWMTMLGVVGVVILVLLVVIVLCCICCVAADDPQKVQTKHMRPTRTVVVPVQNERTIEKRDVLIQMPSGERKLVAHSEHHSSQHSKRLPRRTFSNRQRSNVYPIGFENVHQARSQRDKDSYENSAETSPEAPMFGPRQSPYHGF